MPPLLFQAVATADNENDVRRRNPNANLGARKLWENTRGVDSTWVDTCRAILYELQVVRFSIVLHYMSHWDKYSNQIFSAFAKLCVSLYQLLIHYGGNKAFRQKLTSYLTWNNLLGIGGIFVYFYAIRILHRLFYAGPIIIILTAMIIIWTIGLQDNDHQKKNVGGGIFLSAYSVFNRHCRSMLGSLDADALVEQYVAGGGGGGRLAALPGGRVVDRAQPAEGEQAGAIPQHQQQQEQQQRPTSRKSGKKARRGNIEHRRDRQRQRQIAAQMGLINEEMDVLDEIEQLVDENDF